MKQNEMITLGAASMWFESKLSLEHDMREQVMSIVFLPLQYSRFVRCM